MLALLLALVAPCATYAALQVPHSFENTNVVRTIDLGGSSVHVTTALTARALAPGSSSYYLALPRNEDERTSWLDVKVKGNPDTLSIKKHGIEALLHKSEPVVYYSVELPKSLDVNASVNLVVYSIQSHASVPLPATARQGEDQALLYQTAAYFASPYKTITQRTKFRAPTPTILSYSQQDQLSKFATESPVTKSGASITYGPYQDVPPSVDVSFAQEVQQAVKIHYIYDRPVVTVATLKRAAEISHWGANLNIQDEILLQNSGPKLEGHFSRIAHQQQAYLQKKAAHVFNGFVMPLPAGIRDPYFFDLVGNVSTSKFRPAPAKSARGGAQFSTLEVRPRYPILGGWNYSFTLGWDAPLEHSAKYDASTGKYIVGVPFFTHIPGTVVDEAEVKLVLPEGAANVEIHTPFPVDSIERYTHITYLDTTGRPAIVFKKHGLTEKHTDLIYVTYTVSLMAHLTKVFAVGLASLSLFSLMLVLRRVDTDVNKKKSS